MDIDQFLQELANTDKTLISDRHCSWTGKQLAEKVQDLCKQLKKQGIADNRACLLRMNNNLDSVAVLLAALSNRAVVFVANPHDPITKVRKIIKQFSVYALFSDKASSNTIHKNQAGISGEQHALAGNALFTNTFGENDKPVSDFSPKLANADLAIFSSGSTGEPKAIMHKLSTVLLNAALHIEAIGLSSASRIGVSLPLYYSYGLVANLFAGLLVKAELYLHPQMGSVDIEWMDTHRINTLSLTPFLAKKLTGAPAYLTTLTVGGDLLYSKQARELLSALPDCTLYSTYGLTEAGPRVSTHKVEFADTLKHSIIPLGTPLSGVSLALDDSAPGYGELLIKTPTPMLGYLMGSKGGFTVNDQDTVESGDLYELKNGNFYFAGRKKKIIIQGGEKIFPQMIESAIHEIEGVIEVKVGSVQCKDKGQIAKAYVVADPTLVVPSIKKTLMKQFSRSLIPEQIELVDALPRNLAGKVTLPDATSQ